jgi:hypothetical protein
MFFFRRRMAKCGHETRTKGEVEILGRRESLRMSQAKPPEFCLSCVAKMAIRCAWCGGVILIGDPISIGRPPDKIARFPEYAKFYGQDMAQVIGCLRDGCSEFAFISGYWVAPGKVRLLEVIEETAKEIVLA